MKIVVVEYIRLFMIIFLMFGCVIIVFILLSVKLFG